MEYQFKKYILLKDGEYKTWGGTKTKEEFNTELFELIG
jgi:hypothetical protein